jgi:hypothetical protein
VAIAATVQLEDEDIYDLENLMLSKHNFKVDRASISRSFEVARKYKFQDSSLTKTNATWGLSFTGRLKSTRKRLEVDGTDPKSDATEEDPIKVARAFWLSALESIRPKLPKIVFFPTFLFTFPDRIYLNSAKNEVNDYYVQVLQDVLDSLNEGLSVTKYIVDRISEVAKDHPTPMTLLAALFGRDEKSQIDAVLQKASNRMSEVIFGAWNEILGRSVTGKRVQISWLLDVEKNNAPYLELSIVDGQSSYKLSERSLGFRWFFSFLLFTQFRKNRAGNQSTIFLFDEPAANLHSRAQMKLLESFPKIAGDKTFILYSTHSHYMVNPLWLEKAYIVENSATDYDSEDDVNSFSMRKTDIRAVNYRTFVANNPSKTTYFQPVIDALDVSFSPLVKTSRAVLLEGKYDFHSFLFFWRRLSKPTEVGIFPGSGAGHSSAVISLFRGWGVDFRILLDDDKGGRESKKKYSSEFLLREEECVTLADVSPTFKDHKFEDFYQEDVVTEVKKYFGVPQDKSVAKGQYALFFQYLLLNNISLDFEATEE